VELGAERSTIVEAEVSETTSPALLREDWGEAPQAVNLYGREKECSELAVWIGEQQCRIVAVLGMGVLGKRLWPQLSWRR